MTSRKGKVAGQREKSNDECFEVERILDMKTFRNNKRRFLMPKRAPKRQSPQKELEKEDKNNAESDENKSQPNKSKASQESMAKQTSTKKGQEKKNDNDAESDDSENDPVPAKSKTRNGLPRKKSLMSYTKPKSDEDSCESVDMSDESDVIEPRKMKSKNGPNHKTPVVIINWRYADSAPEAAGGSELMQHVPLAEAKVFTLMLILKAWWGNSINAKEGFIEALSKFSSKRESPATVSCCFPAARIRCCLSNEGNECAQLGNSRK
ncbi:hypothetical protein DdX_12001 [Ditylenchus destructor]|uniref:Uncharacterized protein n=1 Tax=Ditylenchus destructor TaxID=166010 RepID=A0AAD4R3Y4_9BILA|nr:hypothetical protein DdX_12001 [Ditylenchus destructor]